jgi:MOSC domain-containing protein YiiM
VGGRVVGIHILAAKGDEPRSVTEVRAVVGKGLEGDRYFDFAGTETSKPGPDRHVTLIEVEELERLRAEHGIALTAAASRRNLAVEGARLNELVGKEFTVGGVRLRGVRLCNPCARLEKLSGLGGLTKAMHGRCGLRAEIVRGGILRVSDSVGL